MLIILENKLTGWGFFITESTDFSFVPVGSTATYQLRVACLLCQSYSPDVQIYTSLYINYKFKIKVFLNGIV